MQSPLTYRISSVKHSINVSSIIFNFSFTSISGSYFSVNSYFIVVSSQCFKTSNSFRPEGCEVNTLGRSFFNYKIEFIK